MIVGEAHIVVRAITGNVRNDIRRAFGDVDGIGEDAGKRVSNSFAKGFGNFGQSLASQTQAARRQFDTLIRTAYTLGPALAQAAGAVGALAGAIGALGGIVAGAIPSLIVLPGLYSAIGQAALTLKLAFSGVSEAISAGMKAQQASVSSGTKAAKKDLSSYKNAIADAWRALQRLWVTSNERADDAARAVQEAVLEVAKAEEEGARRIAEAKRTVEEAQMDLNAAYEEAREQIQQLNFDAEDAALNEKRAALELEKARQTLLRTQDLPPNSTARREAELAYAQADLNYRRAIDANADMAEEQKRVAEEGADGTKVVQDAKKKLADAEQDYADTVIDVEEDIADARRKAAREFQEQQRINRDIIWEIEDAERRLEEAEAALAKARKDGGAAGVAAANNYNAALQKLSPEAQKFVKFMVDEFIPSIDDLKAAAGKEFFPKLITAMTKIKDDLFPKLEPLLQSTGGILGDIAVKFADVVTNAENLEKIKGIWKANEEVIKSLGEVGANALDGILSVFLAATPLLERFADWLEIISNKFRKLFDTKSERSELTAFFEEAGNIAAELGKIFGDTFSGLGNIIRDLMKPDSGGWMLLEFFGDIAEKFKEFTSSEAGTARIREFFQNTAANAIEIMKAVGPFVKELLKLGENPSIGEFAGQMGDLAEPIGDIAAKFADAGPSMGNFIGKLVEFIDITTDTGAIQAFWDTLSNIADVLIDFFSKPEIQGAFVTIAKIAATLSALRLAFDVLKMPVLALLYPINAAVSAFGFLGGLIGKTGLGKDFKIFFSLFQSQGFQAFKFLPLVFTSISAPVVIAGAAIAGLVAAFVAMWRESETFRNALKKLVDGILTKARDIFEELKEKVEQALEPLGGTAGVVDKLKAAFKFLGDILGKYVIPVFGFVAELVMTVLGKAIGFLIDYTGFLIRAWKFAWDTIWSATEVVVNWFMDTVWPIIKRAIDLIVDAFKAMWGVVQSVWSLVYSAIEKVVKWFQQTAWPIIKNVLDLISTGFNTVKTVLETAWGKIKTAIETVGNWLRDTLWPIISTVWGNIKTGAGLVWDKIKEVFTWIKDKIEGVFETVRDILWPILQGAFTSIKNAAGFVWDKIKQVFDDVQSKINGVFEFVRDTALPIITGAFGAVKDAAGEVWTKVQTVFDDVKDKVMTVAGKVRGFLSGLWSGLTSGLSSAFTTIKNTLNSIGRGINKLIDGANGVNPFGDPIPRLPEPLFKAAKGGIVQPRPGGTLGLVAEAGRPERIEPLDPDGLSKRDKAMIQFLTGGTGTGGNTFNVYPSEGMDERELADMIARQIAFQMRKGASS